MGYYTSSARDRKTEALRARKWWTCAADSCRRLIGIGELYVQDTFYPGHEWHDIDTPVKYRICLDCATDDDQRIAAAARVIADARRARAS